MIEHLAHRIAVKIKQTSPDETASVDVMKYALIGILNNTVTISAALVVGLIFGTFWEVLLTVFCFMTLRLVSGGYHFKGSLSCFIFSFNIFTFLPFLPTEHVSLTLLNTISLILCFLFAPSNIKAHIRVSEKYFFIFKLLSVIMVLTGYLLENSIVILAFLAQSLTLITFKREEVITND